MEPLIFDPVAFIAQTLNIVALIGLIGAIVYVISLLRRIADNTDRIGND